MSTPAFGVANISYGIGLPKFEFNVPAFLRNGADALGINTLELSGFIGLGFELSSHGYYCTFSTSLKNGNGAFGTITPFETKVYISGEKQGLLVIESVFLPGGYSVQLSNELPSPQNPTDAVGETIDFSANRLGRMIDLRDPDFQFSADIVGKSIPTRLGLDGTLPTGFFTASSFLGNVLAEIDEPSNLSDYAGKTVTAYQFPDTNVRQHSANPRH